ncbi:MAG: flavodoxin domain-containing protein [Candidatus Odinarchaeota archaeon]
MKKVLVLYDSFYGNTKKVAMSLSRGLEAGGLYVDSKSINDFDIQELKNYDIIGIGGPTHSHGVSKKMNSFLKKIKYIKMENKLGFAFETKTEFILAGSAAKRINHYLKRMKLKIIHPVITGIVLDKKGPLQEHTSDLMEHFGLKISENLDIDLEKNEIFHEINRTKKPKYKRYLNRLKWILIGGGSLFFFIKALYFACTGGDCFSTIDPFASWVLLFSEIVLSGITWILSLISLTFWIKSENLGMRLKKLNVLKIILTTGSMTYITHFIRVAIWIILCLI